MTPGTLPWQQLWPLLSLFASLLSPVGGTICAGLTYYTANTSSQTFTSPDYPSNYGINVFCSWLIEAADSSHMVRITVDTSSLEDPDSSGSCSYDYASAYDGNSMSSLLGQWCGTSTPTFTSTSSQMLVVFRSDYTTVSTGFSLSYLSGTFPVASSSTDYTVIIACSVTAFVIIVGIIVFCCIRSRMKEKKKQQASDKEKLPQAAEDVEANHEKYPDSGKARFSQRIIPSSKGKRPLQDVAVEPETTAVSRVATLNAAAAAAAKTKEEKEREKEERKKEMEQKRAEEKKAKEEQRAKAAEEKKRVAEEKRVAAEKAAEEKRRVAEERKIAAEKAAEEKRQAAEEKRVAAAKAAEEKRIAAEKAAEEKQKLAEEKKQEAERAAEEKKQAAEKLAEEKKQAAQEKQKSAAAAKSETTEAKEGEAEQPSKGMSPAVDNAAAVNASASQSSEEKARPVTKQANKKKVGFEEFTQEIEPPEPEVTPETEEPAAPAAASNASLFMVQGMNVEEKSKSEVKDSSQKSSGKEAGSKGKEKKTPKPKETTAKGNAKAEKTSDGDTKSERPLTRQKSNINKTDTNTKGKAPVPPPREKSTVDKSSAKKNVKTSDAAPKDKPKPEKPSNTGTKPKTPQSTEKPKTPKDSAKEGKSDVKETSKSAVEVSVKAAAAATVAKETASKENKKAEKPTAKVEPLKGGNAPTTKDVPKKEKSKPEKKQKEGKISPETHSEPEKTDHGQTSSETPEVQLTDTGSVAFGNKPGEVTRPGSKVVLLPTVVMVESAESKKRKKMEDQWDKLSIARQDQVSVQGGDVTPRVTTVTGALQKKYQHVSVSPQLKEEERGRVKFEDDKTGERKRQTSGSVASLEKDEGIHMDYEGGESGKSTPASRPPTVNTPRTTTPRDNTVVTPSVVNPSIVTSIVSGTGDGPRQQPVPIESPVGGESGRRMGTPGTPDTRSGSPIEGSVQDIEKRLKVALQWPRPWTYKSLQFTENDVSNELSMQRAKTSLNVNEHAGVHGAPSPVPRIVKNAFGSEDTQNSAMKNVVLATLAKGSSKEKIEPRGRNLITR